MKKRYWKVVQKDQSVMYIQTDGNVTITNGEEISRYKYYKERNK